jgi:pyruvate formate lyase activating enzyme
VIILPNTKAKYYEKKKDNYVHCLLCPHGCRIKEGQRGICGIRKNNGGELYSESYGKISSIALDPIEKKPLYHFHPGVNILSIGSYGCNFSCSFCQNYSISMEKPQTYLIPPETLIAKANELKNANNIGIAYTYNEPLINYEYVLDCCKLAHQNNLKNVLVTNGYIRKDPLTEILPYVDAMNIDLKSFNNKFYRKYCGGEIEHVKETIKTAAPVCHVEITCLIIPGLNDSLNEIAELAKWLSSLSDDIPLHLTRFFPRYKLDNIIPTPINVLTSLANEARKDLKHVYIGNV